MITETILYANSITLKGTQLFSFSFFSVSVELIIGRVCRCSCVHILLLFFFARLKSNGFQYRVIIIRYQYAMLRMLILFSEHSMLHRLNES